MKKNIVREAKEELERVRENQFKSRGGRGTQIHRDPKAYTRKEKHKQRW